MKKLITLISIAIMTFYGVNTTTVCYSKPSTNTFTEKSDNSIQSPTLLDMDNTRINSDNSSAAQYNEAIAINCQNPANAVIIWEDMRTGYPRVAVGYTFDGGQTWSDQLLDLPSYPCQSDPSIGADTNGSFFACMIGIDSTGENPKDIIILQSTDGGISWSEPRIAVAGSVGYHNIMPKVMIDNTQFSSSGFVYVAWVQYVDDISASQVYCTMSSDDGLSFLDPVQISDGIDVRWPGITIRSAYGNGDVDVCWFRSHPKGIYWDRSVTEGWSFNIDVRLTVYGTDYDEINGGVTVSTTPVMAGDINNESPGFQNSYIIYMDSSDTDLDIFCVRVSTEYDQRELFNFTTRIRVNDDPLGNGADQFMPAVAVDESGTIHVAYLDRRRDQNNLLYDLYYTSSSDSGDTWSRSVRISNISSDPTQANVAGKIGNQIGIAARNGQVIITWTDTRNGNSDVYASRMIPTGIAEPHAVLPKNISFDNLYPNPFNSSVEIKYSSSSPQHVSLDVIDLLGRQIADLFDGICRAGSNSIIWNGQQTNGKNVSSGTYFIRLSVKGHTLIKKVVLLR